MKKSFCEPCNISFCPPIRFAEAFAIGGASGFLEIQRSPENGGNVKYTSASDLEKDYASGKLHPGDLKAATTALAVEVLEKLSGAIKADKDATQASKTLKAFQKKNAKKKK
jgi:tyrosyl-tRNA synthetase